jgi:hypothetical protein
MIISYSSIGDIRQNEEEEEKRREKEREREKERKKEKKKRQHDTIMMIQTNL